MEIQRSGLAADPAYTGIRPRACVRKGILCCTHRGHPIYPPTHIPYILYTTYYLLHEDDDLDVLDLVVGVSGCGVTQQQWLAVAAGAHDDDMQSSALPSTTIYYYTIPTIYYFMMMILMMMIQQMRLAVVGVHGIHGQLVDRNSMMTICSPSSYLLGTIYHYLATYYLVLWICHLRVCMQPPIPYNPRSNRPWMLQNGGWEYLDMHLLRTIYKGILRISGSRRSIFGCMQ